MRFSEHLKLAKKYWQELFPQESSLIIDATCGNGHDTLFLAQLPQMHQIIAMDIQSQAIESTKNLLTQNGAMDRVSLYLTSHETFDLLPFNGKKPKLIIYNLGYLPGQNKQLTTKTSTTLSSLSAALHILEKGGAISVTCYPGHDEGLREEEAILSWVQSLDPKQWLVSHHRWPNRLRSPSLFWIVSRG